MFDPTIGRWISEDPSGIQPDEDPFRYCHNDPLNFTDPTGLMEEKQEQPFRLYDEKGAPVGTWTDTTKPVQPLDTIRLTNIRCKMKDLDPKAANPEADCVIGKLTVTQAVDRTW